MLLLENETSMIIGGLANDYFNSLFFVCVYLPIQIVYMAMALISPALALQGGTFIVIILKLKHSMTYSTSLV